MSFPSFVNASSRSRLSTLDSRKRCSVAQPSSSARTELAFKQQLCRQWHPLATGPRDSASRFRAAAMATMERTMGQHESPDDGAEATVRSFFQAFNRRDLTSMSACVAEDIEHSNLAYTHPFEGKQTVVEFYAKFMRTMPEDATFHIEDTTGGGPGGKIGVIWQLRVGGVRVPNSRGVSFFKVNAANEISFVRESPEHFVKMTGMALPTLSVVSPLLSAAKPLLDSHAGHSAAELLQDVSTTAGRSLVSLLPKEWTSGAAAEAPPRRAQPAPSATAASPADHGMHSVEELRRRAAGSLSEDQDDVFAMARTVSGAEVAMRPLTAPPPAPTGVKPATDSDSEDEVAPVQRSSNDLARTLAGMWKKVKARSDEEGYGRALSLMGVGGIQKSTAMLIDGMEVRHSSEAFEVFYLTVVPYFKVRESYRFGSSVSQSRRDLRGGKQTAVAQQAGDRVVVDVSWPSPHAGEAHEEYWLGECGCLHVESTVIVNGDRETTLQVYEQQAADGMDDRYFAKGQKIPFGVDPNSLPGNMAPW